MFESIAEQYLLIAFAVSVVLGIKYWTVKKSYSNKLQTYVPPQLLLPDIKTKLKKLQNYDIRILLSQNLTSLKEDPTKMRSIAILLALMKEDKINIQPFVNRIKLCLGEIDYDGQPEFVRTYRDYVLNQVKVG